MLADQIDKDILDAMRARDTLRLATLRMLKAALVNRRVEKGRDLDETEAQQVATSLIKQRRESIEQFTRGGRPELAARELTEIGILETYLPPSVPDDEIEETVRTAIASIPAPSAKDVGPVMKAVMAAFAGRRVDGKAVNAMVRRHLGA